MNVQNQLLTSEGWGKDLIILGEKPDKTSEKDKSNKSNKSQEEHLQLLVNLFYKDQQFTQFKGSFCVWSQTQVSHFELIWASD